MTPSTNIFFFSLPPTYSLISLPPSEKQTLINEYYLFRHREGDTFWFYCGNKACIVSLPFSKQSVMIHQLRTLNPKKEVVEAARVSQINKSSNRSIIEIMFVC